LEGDISFLTWLQRVPTFFPKDLARALRLTWCQESVWWITYDIEEREENPQRFFQEIMWISDNWDILEEILGDHVSK
jgi:homoserine kinase type II